MNFHANATREDEWWVVTVPDIGTTQGRTRKETEAMAVDLVACMLDMDPSEIQVDVTFGPLDGER